MKRPGQNLLSKLWFSQSTLGSAKTLKEVWSTKTVLQLLSRLQYGHLKITLPDATIHDFGDKTNAPDTLSADIQIFDWCVFTELLSHGDIGFAESYIRGQWNTSNLQRVLQLAIRNRTLLEKTIYGSWLGSIIYRIKHRLRDNSKVGSRKNIHAHYDLGNDFYSLWLDPSMSYSSAWFCSGKAQTLQEAQRAKIHRILDSIDSKPGDHILEIGSGWGGVMEEALRSGRSITGLTLSTEQKAYTENRLLNMRGSNHFEVRLQDYRDCHDQFDGIVSVEMFEAVGEKHWPEYFQALAQCLKPNKKACIQTIVIADDLFEKYRRNTDFIQQYVFPGGMLPSRNTFRFNASKAGLQIEKEFSFGLDYAKTLSIWRENFNQKLTAIRQLGFDEAFIRLWNFYLMYCAAGFLERSIDVVQFTLSHQAHQSTSHTLSA